MPAKATTTTSQPGPSKATRDPTEIRPSNSRTPTAQAIALVDRSVSFSAASPHESGDDDAPSPNEGLIRKSTKQSLQQSLAHRKYARYQEDKLFRHDSQPEDPAAEVSQGYGRQGVKWGKKKVKGLLKTRRQFQLAEKEDAAIDVLWENQRGWWAFGIPHFSSKSLLNFDPNPWLNGHRKASPVDITNAQVPDPDWEWAWKSWYVDMSRDVDEEGWEYSFSFNRGFSWHGSHPWGHSWVRRRRWLRKRVRKHRHHDDGRPDQKHMTDAHHLNTDYFTIHPANDPSRSNSLVPSSLLDKVKSRVEEEENEEPAEIKDIGTLYSHLKRAALDREKIVLIRYFVDNGGDDVYYLQEHMPKIMSLFIFQNSRRQLLMMLMEECDAAARHRDGHEKRGEPEGTDERRKIDNLLKAIEAADEQVKKLEYWSDQRRLVREGMAGHIEGWGDKWQGLDQSGPSSNSASTSKEKGKTIEDVHEEALEQISPPGMGPGGGRDDEGPGKDEAELDKKDESSSPATQSAQAEYETQFRSMDGKELKLVEQEELQTSDSEAMYLTARETAADNVEETNPGASETESSHAHGEDDPRMIERAKEWAKRQGEGKSKVAH